MNADEFLKEYYAALQERSKAENAVKMLEMRARLGIPAANKQLENERYLDEVHHELADEDLAFVRQEYRDFAAVQSYLANYLRSTSRASTQRYLKNNGILPVKLPGERKNHYSTIEIVKVVNGETQEKAKRL